MAAIKEKTLGVCCPIFHPEKWDDKIFYWNEKKFIVASIPTLFHIPFPPLIGKKVTKMMEKAESAHQIEEDKEEVLLLFTDPSAFKSEIYLSVTGEVPEAQNTTLSGTFRSKAFKGTFRDVPKYMKAMDAHLKELNEEVENYFVHYAYCPKCEKEAGHNYLVLFAKISGSIKT